jgi:rhodanese-related sulfurtransferase
MLTKSIATLTISISFFIACGQQNPGNNSSVKDFEKAIKPVGTQLLDVRTKQEFEGGHLNNALNANFNNQQEFNDRTAYLDKDKPVYVYCQSGGRSADACLQLTQLGFTKVVNLVGGISAWKDEQKPVVGASPTKKGIQESEYNHLINKEQTALVVISTKWCPPCRKLAVEIDSLQQEIKGVKIIKLDGNENATICAKLGIKNFPVVLHYKLGKQLWRNDGFVTKNEMKAELLKK